MLLLVFVMRYPSCSVSATIMRCKIENKYDTSRYDVAQVKQKINFLLIYILKLINPANTIIQLRNCSRAQSPETQARMPCLGINVKLKFISLI